MMNNSTNKKESSKSKRTFKSLLTSLIEILICKLVVFYRRMSKVVLHLITGKCELERICTKEANGSIRIRKIENNFLNSSNPFLNNLLCDLNTFTGNEEELVFKIMKTKNIPQNLTKVQFNLKDALIKINSYQNLTAGIEEIRTGKFSRENQIHCDMLMNVWTSLKGQEGAKLDSLITKKWTEIGFQGADPSTDFRGMGMLALESLNYMMTRYQRIARNIYAKSLHPLHGYPFAIVGINIVAWTHNFLIEGDLKNYFFNYEFLSADNAKIENFYRIFVFLFLEFNKFWFGKKPNVMQFESISKEYTHELKTRLNNSEYNVIKDSHLDNVDFVEKNYFITEFK